MEGETDGAQATPFDQKGDGSKHEAFPVNPISRNPRMNRWLEQAWLQRYLDRKLEDDEVEWFEVYALDKPELIASIEADNDLRDGMSIAQPARTSSNVTPIRRTAPASPRTNSPLAWVASAVVGIGLGWIMATQVAPPAPGVGPDIIASPTRIVFDTMRGIEDAPQIYPGSADSLYLLIEVGVPADAKDVQLVGLDGQPLPLTVSSDGFVSFLLPRAKDDTPMELAINFNSGGEELSRELSINPSH